MAAGGYLLFVGKEICEIGELCRESGCGYVVDELDIDYIGKLKERIITNLTSKQLPRHDTNKLLQQRFPKKQNIGHFIQILNSIGP